MQQFWSYFQKITCSVVVLLVALVKETELYGCNTYSRKQECLLSLKFYKMYVFLSIPDQETQMDHGVNQVKNSTAFLWQWNYVVCMKSYSHVTYFKNFQVFNFTKSYLFLLKNFYVFYDIFDIYLHLLFSSRIYFLQILMIPLHSDHSLKTRKYIILKCSF